MATPTTGILGYQQPTSSNDRIKQEFKAMQQQLVHYGGLIKSMKLEIQALRESNSQLKVHEDIITQVNDLTIAMNQVPELVQSILQKQPDTEPAVVRDDVSDDTDITYVDADCTLPMDLVMEEQDPLEPIPTISAYPLARTAVGPIDGDQQLILIVETSVTSRNRLAPPGTSCTTEEAKKQAVYYPQAQFIPYSFEQLSADKSQFAQTFNVENYKPTIKETLDAVKDSPFLQNLKLDSNKKQFTIVDPKEACEVFYLTCLRNIEFLTPNFSAILGLFRILAISSYHGFNARNPYHINALKYSMYELGLPIHPSQYWYLLTIAEPIFIKFFKEDLGWDQMSNLRFSANLKSMISNLAKVPFTKAHPAIGIFEWDARPDTKATYDDLINKIQNFCDLNAFTMYPIDPSIKKLTTGYESKTIFTDITNSFNAIVAEAKSTKFSPLKHQTKFNKGIKHVQQSIDHALQQRDFFASLIVMLIARDLTRDPKFEKQVIKIVNKLNTVLLAETSIMPLDELKMAITDFVEETTFKPTSNCTLMHTSIMKDLGTDTRNVPLFKNNVANVFTLNSLNTKPVFKCKQCKISHTKGFACLPKIGDTTAWKNYSITSQKLTAINIPQNTASAIDRFIETVINNKSKHLSNTESS